MERTLSDQDMVDILEDIAQNAGNAAARIAAIKALREMGNEPADNSGGGLYDVDNPGRIRKKAA